MGQKKDQQGIRPVQNKLEATTKTKTNIPKNEKELKNFKGNLKPVGYASRLLSDAEKKYVINELEILIVVCGLEHFSLHIYGQPIELLTNHHVLEPLIKRNRSNKTYSAKLTRWLDRLAHFDIKLKHLN